VLLLDEPTNHLDLHAVLWLEEYLQGWGKSLVVVSHARSFLNSVCTDMLHFYDGTITRYKGDYDTFETTRSDQLKQQGRASERVEAQRAHMQARRRACAALRAPHMPHARVFKRARVPCRPLSTRTAATPARRAWRSRASRPCRASRWSRLSWMTPRSTSASPSPSRCRHPSCRRGHARICMRIHVQTHAVQLVGTSPRTVLRR
jgi:energy-coupling factor transporter ATP-binding protein EcfA2